MLCLILGIGSAWAEEVTLDFEGTGTFPYSADWTVGANNCLTSYTSDKHTGSACAQTSGAGNTLLTYNNKLTDIQSVSVWVSKTSKNTTSSPINIQYSSNNSSWETIGTIDFDNNSAVTGAGVWAELKVENINKTGYIRITKSGSGTAVRLLDDITIVYGSASKKDVTLFNESSYSVAPGASGNISDFVNVPADYDGTIYYGSNDDNVFVLESNGDYLAGDGGSTTIYATAAATSKYNQIYEEVTINVEKQKAAPNISFATPSYTFTCFDEDKTTQSLSNPHSLPVTYTSSNTNVATVNEDGAVTVKDYAGTATITATFAGNEDYKAGSASFAINVNRAETGYAFSESSVDVTIGESFDVPTISATNPNADLKLTFTSSKTSVVEVTATGNSTYNLTIKGTGSATIKASWNQTVRFERGEISFDINVTNPNSSGSATVYRQVTSTSDLVAGNKYILVCEAANVAMSELNNSKGQKTDVVITNHSINAEDYNLFELELVESTDNAYPYSFITTGSNKLNSGSSSTTNLNQTSTGDGIIWNVSFKNGNLVMYSKANTNARQIMFRTDVSPNVFGVYATSSKYNAVQLYVREEGEGEAKLGQFTISDYFTDGEGNYYGTFYSENAWEVPAGVEAQAVGVTDDKLTISTLNDNDNNVVAAGTAVLLKASAPGTYVYAESEEDGVSDANNLLDGSSEAVTVESMSTAHPNCIYYRMTKHNGTTLGFWWGAEDGAAFALAANKAYLAVPTQQASNLLGFRFGDYTITAIQEAELQNKGAAIYNLQGQRINRLQQGVNIVNGRKVIR